MQYNMLLIYLVQKHASALYVKIELVTYLEIIPNANNL